MKEALKYAGKLKEAGDSSGGKVRITVKNIPPGIGEPLFYSLDGAIASAMMSIGGVKSVEIGMGTSSADSRGKEFHDEFYLKEGTPRMATNHCGGVLAGIACGEDLVITLAVKPVPSIKIEKTGATLKGTLKNISVKGRHDTNITPRVAPIAGSMAALIIMDFLMLAGNIRKDYQ